MPKRRKKRKAGKSVERIALLTIIFVLVMMLFACVTYFALQYIEKQNYSIEYKEKIEKYSAEYELDPVMVAAVMHCESSGKSDAVSNKGAIGLMQIMPETGEWIAHKLNIENYSTDMLYDADINIKMGCWYLWFLKDRFNNEFVNYIAAYNAGHGKVESWLENKTYSENGVLTNIPYSETREYVKRVKKAMEEYEDIYNAEYSQ